MKRTQRTYDHKLWNLNEIIIKLGYIVQIMEWKEVIMVSKGRSVTIISQFERYWKVSKGRQAWLHKK